MFLCTECLSLFEEPQYWEETHMLDTPPYEKMSGCPYCKGDYIKTYRCNSCGEWITTDTYVEVDDNRYCENCYLVVPLE